LYFTSYFCLFKYMVSFSRYFTVCITYQLPLVTWQWVHKTSGERLSTVKLVLENKNFKNSNLRYLLVPVWNKWGETTRNLSHDSSSLDCALNLGPPTHEVELMTSYTHDCNICLWCFKDIQPVYKHLLFVSCSVYHY